VAEPLGPALERVRALLLDPGTLVRAVAAGRRRGAVPRWRRTELRYVDLKAGRHLQVTSFDDTQAFASNHREDAAEAVDRLLEEPFGNWHVWFRDAEGLRQLQLRVTKKGDAMVHVAREKGADAAPAVGTAGPTVEQPLAHDRHKQRMLPEDDPVLVALGIADERGRVKPSRQAKYRQVEEFLRLLDAALDDAFESGAVARPTDERPLTVVDLGCGNAYLTFAAHRHLTVARGLQVRVTGVDVKEQSLAHNTAVAEQLGVAGEARFVQADIGSDELAAWDVRPDVVLALHACDTATDDALAQAVTWEAGLVLAAPCCHHDVAAQLRTHEAPAPYSFLVRDGILRERFADTLTDALRAASLRLHGYRVDVVEFVESRHTPRNTLIRAVRTLTPAGASGGAPASTPARGSARAELEELTTTWQVRPRLQALLDGPDPRDVVVAQP
jgi:SAM-dependent methyltransferase